jgi:hypothetical protein
MLLLFLELILLIIANLITYEVIHLFIGSITI